MAEEWRTMAIILDRLLFWMTLLVLIGFALWLSFVSLNQPPLKPGTVLANLDY